MTQELLESGNWPLPSHVLREPSLELWGKGWVFPFLFVQNMLARGFPGHSSQATSC